MSNTRIQTFAGDVEVLGSFTGANLSVNGAATNAFVARGTIGLWSGSEASIPSGWQKCDGTNGTPDLQNRFVTGATANRAIGTTGGANTRTLSNNTIPSHTHNGATNSTSGTHKHILYVPSYDGRGGAGQGWPGGGYNAYRSNDRGYGAGVTFSACSDTGSHNHNLSASNYAGSTQAFDSRPAFRALYYIMKL